MRLTSATLQATRATALPAGGHLRLSPHGAARVLTAATTINAATPRRSLFNKPATAPSPASPSISLPRRALPQQVRSYSDVISEASLVQTTTLPNGIRVATEGTPGHFAAAGVYVDAGSRFERPWIAGESGVSHLLDRMAFKSTSNRTAEAMTQAIEKLGGNVMCTSSRETILYQSAMFHQDLPAVMSLLADTIQHPLLLQEELDAQREAALWEIREIWNKPELINPELLHMVAYRDNTLGNPLLCPEESLQQMTADNLKEFIKTWYTPERMVVAGAGVPHEDLLALTEKLFGNTKASESVLGGSANDVGAKSSLSTASSGGKSASPASQQAFSTTTKTDAAVSSLTPHDIASQKARYTGGEYYMERDDLDFTHVYLAFEGVSIHDEDIYALATLQVLLGGGSAFSAGGPGKGMYSKLYNVLNRHHSVDYCAASIHPYADSGLFAIAIAFEPSVNASIGKLLANEIESCLHAGEEKQRTRRFGYGGPSPITQTDLSRARNQLKSSLMMALESRLVEVEDLGRQIQSHGKKMSVAEMCQKIDQVDLPALQRVARRIFTSGGSNDQPLNHGLGSGQATVVAQGKLAGLGDIRQILHQRGIGAKPTLS